MEEKSSGIFRQKSLERISSPEQLTDYLKVTNPGIWVLLAAVIVLFAGLFVWSMVGDLETVVDGVAVVHDSTAEIMVTGSVNSKISSGMTVRIGEEEYSISTVEEDDHGRSVAYAPVNEADGKYDVRIVTESIHPIKFLFD
ncbi:hypothetical protein [uncultured Ruminococcus sp.]|uniref:hypothetical protein n=1 Tax=uncultured Ruminococcus sp. TaxID=165186 RepID=UPI0025FCD663|nr:hypothetical protein [uncultured Ruminococcus sp.]